jgi:hypothetical protein
MGRALSLRSMAMGLNKRVCKLGLYCRHVSIAAMDDISFALDVLCRIMSRVMDLYADRFLKKRVVQV